MLAAALAVPAVVAEDVNSLPKPTAYVSDFAGVMDASSKAQMEQLCAQIDRQAHAQIAVVTIKSLDGDDIDDYASKLEEKWRVGPKDTDRGLIILLSVGDHKDRIEVGYGLEGILNDAKTGDIRRAAISTLHAGQYGPGLLIMTQQVAGVIAADAGVTLNTQQDDAQQYHYQRRAKRGNNWLGIVIFLIIFFAIFRGGRSGWMWFLLGNMMGGGWSGGGRDRGDWGGGGGGGDGGGFGGFDGGSSGGGGSSGDF